MTSKYVGASEAIVWLSGSTDVSHILLGREREQWRTSCGLEITFDLYGTNPVYTVEAGVASCRKCLPCALCGTEGTVTLTKPANAIGLHGEGRIEVCENCLATHLGVK